VFFLSVFGGLVAGSMQLVSRNPSFFPFFYHLYQFYGSLAQVARPVLADKSNQTAFLLNIPLSFIPAQIEFYALKVHNEAA
jgi:hypothetical protein